MFSPPPIGSVLAVSFFIDSLYTPLATTDLPSVLPENHVILPPPPTQKQKKPPPFPAGNKK